MRRPSLRRPRPRWPLLRVAVAERSMQPTLYPGDWLLVWRTSRVRPGQVVVARHPSRPSMLLVKRASRRDQGGWWLSSDNPDGAAADSRSFGPVPSGLIEGVVLLRYRSARGGGAGSWRQGWGPSR